jgi:hypothetical protein
MASLLGVLHLAQQEFLRRARPERVARTGEFRRILKLRPGKAKKLG